MCRVEGNPEVQSRRCNLGLPPTARSALVLALARECLAINVHRSIDADDVAAILDRLAIERAMAPGFMRFDIHTESRLDRAVVVQLAA